MSTFNHNKFEVGDMLQYFDGLDSHACIVLAVDDDPKGFVRVEWINDKAKRDFTPSLSFTAFDFSYGGWKRLS